MKVADMHCDTIGEIYENRLLGNYYNLKENNFHVDISKLITGEYILQNFAMFIDIKKHKNPYKTLQEMIAVYYEELEANREIINPVYSYEDIIRCEKENKIAALLTIEDAGALEGSLENLKTVYEQGVRLITLTWNYINGVGFPNFKLSVDTSGNTTEKPNFTIPNTEFGLTPFGIELVREMERLGIIVDVSHLSDAGFYDVLKYSKKPFVASHSNARTVTNVVRNLTDDMIKKLADKGGVTGINFCSDFVKPTPHIGSTFTYVEDLVKHIKHIKNVGGIDVLALGTDFDGIKSTLEIEDASKIKLLEQGLLKNGFTYDEVEKIFYKNIMRLYKELL
ncbi:dipeptidase [Clostridium cuniculi]|uniref:dipeptidase n=1 Tax=Clostridium cuniculi TaxID=2548455 RepID=UPI001055F165|nr:dipeptidase [Clostridium cuniculi]